LLSFGMLWLYTVGEVSSQHSIEILFYFIALMTALLMPTPQTQAPLGELRSI